VLRLFADAVNDVIDGCVMEVIVDELCANLQESEVSSTSARLPYIGKRPPILSFSS